MGIAASDSRRNLADFEPVFVFLTVRRVGLLEVMPITIAAQAQPDQPAPQLAVRADA